MESKKLNEEALLEQISSIVHDQWSNWMKYMLKICQVEISRTGYLDHDFPKEDTYKIVISEKNYLSWLRKMNSNYNRLPDQERESDREFGKLYLALFKNLMEEFKVV